MIKRKEFAKGDFKKRKHLKRTEHPIAVLLKNNKSYAFNATEIAKRIKMNINSVRSMLGKLIKEGHVIHKSPYFAWK